VYVGADDIRRLRDGLPGLFSVAAARYDEKDVECVLALPKEIR
jgi:hypothetical protein